jgi:hypothetical protein
MENLSKVIYGADWSYKYANTTPFTDGVSPFFWIVNKRVKKKLCHKIFEKPRKKQKFDNIFDRFCFTHKPS